MTLIASIRKNTSEELRVSLDEYAGRDLLSLRVWYTANDGTQRPGKAGVALRVDALPELREAIIKAEAEALQLGLIKGSSR